MFCVSMENYLTLDNVDVQPEDYSNSFLCCICLDLLYKPVVLACGHISCFWCIHRSMSSRRESHCPICRHTYNHFPNICWMLHLLLLKIYPITYKIREQQILEEEKKIGIFSSQFENHGCELLVYTKVDHLEDSTNSSTAVSVSASKVESLQYMEQLESVSLILNNGTPISKQTSVRTVAAMKKKFPENKLNNCKQIPIADVQCTACKQLLFNPVVLNCGHVYCETCIIKPTNEQLMCQVCGCLNPGGLPKVCLELNQFLDEQFCKEYATRRDVVELTKTLMKDESTTMCCMEAGKLWSLVNTGEDITWWADPHPTVHVKFGCDSCGMFPIIGERYKCIDCVEAAGFDLCGHCYHTRSSIPGRFNQLHTPEHRLELVKPKNIHDMMVRSRWPRTASGRYSGAGFLPSDRREKREKKGKKEKGENKRKIKEREGRKEEREKIWTDFRKE